MSSDTHDALVRLRHIFAIMSGATPASGNEEYWDGDILWITPEDLNDKDNYWLADTHRKITRSGYDSSGTTLAPPHSIALSKRAPIGHLALLKKPACSNQGCFLLVPISNVETRFYYYHLSSRVEWLQALGSGSTFMELGIDALKSLRIPLPPLPRQRAIADYLDRETGRLDALVAAKRRLLELLAEKRRALIAHAVTRGLEPGVRDSGGLAVKEGGAVAAGDGGVAAMIESSYDALVRLRHIFAIMSGATPASGNEEYWDGDILWITPEDLSGKDSYWLADTHRKITRSGYDSSGTTLAPPNSIALSKRAPIGHLALLRKPACSNQGCFLLVPISNVETRFYYYHLSSRIEWLQALGSGSTFMELGIDALKSLRIPLPPLSQQRAIADYLDRETGRLDALAGRTRESVALLRERRAALISAAVGGRGPVASG